MGHERDQERFAPIAERLRAGFGKTLDAEFQRAVKEGIHPALFSRGTLITLAEMIARTACCIIAPKEEPGSANADARASRVQQALLRALTQVMNTEAGKPIATDASSWPDKQGGHA